MDMDREDVRLEEIIAARMREKGVTLKHLGELTGIAPTHLENLLRGNFGDMPSMPYLHGYVVRVGKILDFDGEEWWKKIKAGGFVKDAGSPDVLPRNRFINRKSSRTTVIIGASMALILIYAAFQFPRIAGKPLLTIIDPPATPFTAQSNTMTITGTVKNADSLTLNGDAITINPDGSWQKGVLLQGGVNTFAIVAKKFLGGETDITEEIIYEASGAGVPSASPNPAYPTIHPGTETPATGTFFN